MIEKRTMAVVETGHRVMPIVAMFDTDKNELICYRYLKDDGSEDEECDWYYRRDYEHYFNTLQEANEYVSKRQEYLRSKFKEVYDFIEEMDNIDKEYFKFEKKEYLGRYASSSNDEGDYWGDRRRNAEKKVNILTDLVKTKFLNICGQQIAISDVKRVQWHKEDKATLILQDDTKVKTYNYFEYEIVCALFGSNNSERVITG